MAVGLRAQDANAGFGNKQAAQHRPAIGMQHINPAGFIYPYYITGTALADGSPSCKHCRLAKVHFATSSTF